MERVIERGIVVGLLLYSVSVFACFHSLPRERGVSRNIGALQGRRDQRLQGRAGAAGAQRERKVGERRAHPWDACREVRRVFSSAASVR